MAEEYDRKIRLTLKRFQVTTLRSLAFVEMERRKEDIRQGKIVPALIPTQESLIEELKELHDLLHKKEIKLTNKVVSNNAKKT